MKKLQITLIVIIILLSALLWALQPQAVAMRRESLEPDLIIQPGDLYAALDISLAVGDGRRVNWKPLGWEV